MDQGRYDPEEYIPPSDHSVIGLAFYAIAHWFVVAGAWCLRMAAWALSVAIEKAPEMVFDRAPEIVVVNAPDHGINYAPVAPRRMARTLSITVLETPRNAIAAPPAQNARPPLPWPLSYDPTSHLGAITFAAKPHCEHWWSHPSMFYKLPTDDVLARYREHTKVCGSPCPQGCDCRAEHSWPVAWEWGTVPSGRLTAAVQGYVRASTVR